VTRSVTVRPAAAADLAEARLWYDDQRPGLGDEFLASIADAFTRLEQNPEQFPFYYRDFRRVLVERFPYKVFFRTRGEGRDRLPHPARRQRPPEATPRFIALTPPRLPAPRPSLLPFSWPRETLRYLWRPWRVRTAGEERRTDLEFEFEMRPLFLTSLGFRPR
jgi:hypothetical protein